MFPELKNNIIKLVGIAIIVLILFGLYNDAQQKRKERTDNKTKYGVEFMTNKDLASIEKEIKWEIDHPEKLDFKVEKYLTIFYYQITNGKSGDPVALGYLDKYFVTVIKEFQYKGNNIIIYIQK